MMSNHTWHKRKHPSQVADRELAPHLPRQMPFHGRWQTPARNPISIAAPNRTVRIQRKFRGWSAWSGVFLFQTSLSRPNFGWCYIEAHINSAAATTYCRRREPNQEGFPTTRLEKSIKSIILPQLLTGRHKVVNTEGIGPLLIRISDLHVLAWFWDCQKSSRWHIARKVVYRSMHTQDIP